MSRLLSLIAAASLAGTSSLAAAAPSAQALSLSNAPVLGTTARSTARTGKQSRQEGNTAGIVAFAVAITGGTLVALGVGDKSPPGDSN